MTATALSEQILALMREDVTKCHAADALARRFAVSFRLAQEVLKNLRQTGQVSIVMMSHRSMLYQATTSRQAAWRENYGSGELKGWDDGLRRRMMLSQLARGR